MGDYPPGCAILPFTRIWPYEERCRFSALASRQIRWKWCASCWHNIAISNNVGGVKHCLSTLRPALGKERHFALADGFRFPTKGSLAIVAVRNSVRPNHLFDHNLDHDYYFELPVRGVGCPIITPVIYDTPWRCTGSPTCEPNFCNCS